MNILETERLILRRFTLDDLDEIYRLVYADPKVKDGWSGAQGTAAEQFEGKCVGFIDRDRGREAGLEQEVIDQYMLVPTQDPPDLARLMLSNPLLRWERPFYVEFD